MLGHNSIGSRQPESTALGFGGEIRIKDLGERLPRDATAVVLHRDFDILALWEGNGRTRPKHDIICLHPDCPASRHGLHGIEYYIIDDLIDLPGIDVHGPEVLSDLEVTANIRTMQGKAYRLVEEFDQRDGVPHRGTTFGKGEQLVGEGGGALTRLFRL